MQAANPSIVQKKKTRRGKAAVSKARHLELQVEKKEETARLGIVQFLLWLLRDIGNPEKARRDAIYKTYSLEHVVVESYIGKMATKAEEESHPRTLEWATEHGYKVLTAEMGAVTIKDKTGRPVFSRAPRPPNFDTNVADPVFLLLTKLWNLTKHEAKVKVSEKKGIPFRIQTGFYHNQGSEHPIQFAERVGKVREVLQKLTDGAAGRGLMRHITNVLKTFYPFLAIELARQHERVTQDQSHRNPFWPQCPWSATTLNISPQVVTKIHRDYGNISYGLCAVAVFGQFDHAAGGHLVFDDLKLIVEMRHGDVVLFPSALFLHWNTPIAENEERRSIVWWTCGQTIRYQDMGGITLNAYSEAEQKLIKQRQAQEARRRLKELVRPLKEVEDLDFSDLKGVPSNPDL